ncbi:PH domain-containing protein [Methanomassiliicoccaceae archaeon DOK]|nr:PH domain-containing protein [Methanomassiliicoccaceae archaeon DOK]
MYVLLVVIGVYGLVEPQITYMRYRYRMDDDKIEVRRGIIYITHDMVPIERVHQVDVSEGPINRMYGLANVNITTAGGVVTIEYLKSDVAEAIASKLNEKVIKLLKERD